MRGGVRLDRPRRGCAGEPTTSATTSSRRTTPLPPAHLDPPHCTHVHSSSGYDCAAPGSLPFTVNASPTSTHPSFAITMAAMLRLAVTLSLVFLALCPLVFSLTIHMVPHTHDDVGWLKTVDQYFIGSNSSLQHAAVSNLITATIAALKRVPERKFIYVEQAFFQRWWRQQNDAMKADVRTLVKNGQLEFINGGWCMHDEATTHYIDMIDQTTLGHQLHPASSSARQANPRVGSADWSACRLRRPFHFTHRCQPAAHLPSLLSCCHDPFGHSATHASLLTAAGRAGRDVLQQVRLRGPSASQGQQGAGDDRGRPSPSLGKAVAGVDGHLPLDLGDYGPPARPLLRLVLCRATDERPASAGQGPQSGGLQPGREAV